VPGKDPRWRFTLLDDMEPYRGNVVFLAEGPEGARVLKLYRRRQGRLGEFLAGLSQRFVEKKRGVTAAERRATEALMLALWTAHGFDVPRLLDGPSLRGLGPHVLWMEHCPGPTLAAVLADDARPWDERCALLERVAGDQGRRHAAAVEARDPRLLQEHATLNHVLVCGERLVTFDLEGGFLGTVDPTEALSLELAGTLRSLEKATGERFDEALAAFVSAHGQPELLREAARRAVRSRSLARRLRRWRDRRQRGPRGKSWVMERLLAALDEPLAQSP